MSRSKPLVSESRKYLVTTVAQAKEITLSWLSEIDLAAATSLGLPEVDDRYHVWRVPVCAAAGGAKVGEVVVSAYTTEILTDKTTRPEMLEARLLRKDESRLKERRRHISYPVSSLRNTIGLGDCVELIDDMPAASVDLIFTSPPYFNARPEYSEFEEYEQYLFKMRQVIKRSHRVLNEGRFFVINCAPVLLRRASRNEASFDIGFIGVGNPEIFLKTSCRATRGRSRRRAGGVRPSPLSSLTGCRERGRRSGRRRKWGRK
jgi:hypothetical protein